MFSTRYALNLAMAFLAAAGPALAQSTTGTIGGRVVDSQGRTTPGVVVTVESPSLQGVRSAVTSETGDYILTLLPSGAYTVTFELSRTSLVVKATTPDVSFTPRTPLRPVVVKSILVAGASVATAPTLRVVVPV